MYRGRHEFLFVCLDFFVVFWCVWWMCVGIYAYMQLCVHMCARVCGGQRLTLTIVSVALHFIIRNRVSH